MKGRQLIRLLALTVCLFLLSFSLPVHAQAHIYTFEHNGTTRYDNSFIVYVLDNLDSATEYIFSLQALNLATGQFSITLDNKIVSGVTTDTIVFSLLPYNQIGGLHTPLRVVDSFGQVLGYHFTTPNPVLDWFTDQTIDSVDKTGIGGVVYNPVNGVGYQHNSDLTPTFTPTITTNASGFSLKQDYQRKSIVFNPGNVILLHWQNDPGGYDDTERIRIFNIETQLVVAQYVISELMCYIEPSLTGFSSQFIPLVTNGVNPGWYDPDLLDSCFATDTPVINLTPGAYSYGKTTSGGGVIAEGESIFFITNDLNRQEWNIQGRDDPVREGKQQKIETRQNTRSIHNAFFDQAIADNTTGSIDVENKPFASQRGLYYSPSFVPNTDIVLRWILEADDLLFGQDTFDFNVYVLDTFSMIPTGATFSRTEQLKTFVKDREFDSDFGGMIILIAGTIFAWIMLASVKSPSFLYGLSYSALAVGLMYFGAFSTDVRLLLIISIVLVIIGSIVMQRNMNREASI